MESESVGRRAVRAMGRHQVSAAIVAAAAAVLVVSGGDVRAATRTENFDTAPPNWVGINNTAAGNSYGFSNTNNTGQASGAGEAGGTFTRSGAVNRGMYGDTTIGPLNQNDIIHGDGEFSFGNGATADTDGGFGHQDTAWMQGQGFNVNCLGVGIFEGNPTPASNFRFAALIYTDNNVERVGPRINVPAGQCKFVYDWNPNTDTLTAKLLDTSGVQVPGAISSITVPSSDTFNFDAFGIGSAFNGNTNTGNTYQYFIDAVTYTIQGPPPNPGWNVDADGSWHDAANWLGAVPTTSGSVANFHGAITQGRVVWANNNITVGTLSFDNANSYLLTGLGTLTLQVPSGSGAINVQQGTHKINLPMTVASNTTVTVNGGATLIVADPVTVNSGVTLTHAGAGTKLYQSTITVLGGGGVVFGGATAVEALTLAAGAHGEIAAGASSVLQAGQLNVSGGQLDLQDNKIVTSTAAGSARNGVYDGVQGMVQSGHNGGQWNGNGIVTSQKDAKTGLTAIGVATRAEGTVAMYTYGGDANLDGFVSGDDYSAIDFNITVPGASGWEKGDFNYDGIISGDDYSVIDFNIMAQGAPLTGTAGLSGIRAVPEPASALAVSAITALLCGRRRQRNGEIP